MDFVVHMQVVLYLRYGNFPASSSVERVVDRGLCPLLAVYQLSAVESASYELPVLQVHDTFASGCQPQLRARRPHGPKLEEPVGPLEVYRRKK